MCGPLTVVSGQKPASVKGPKGGIGMITGVGMEA